ncbi:hypothetical protein BAQU_2005 [Bifidobacterium aquikefiri]|uniref:XRE family transcriptional regulator n=2 Tax=Bifidobacterium TaxID=1678 RepID=A0A261G116_9BIFI|nr:hypothetical protein BAQU_2005 [Bifidobacterium aquikefiri]
MQEHTKKVTSALYEMLKNEVPGTSPMTVASAHIGTSYETLRRRLKTGTLSLNDFELLSDLLGLDPGFMYAHPDEAKRKQK